MATYSTTLAWKIPWTEEPGGLQSMRLSSSSSSRWYDFSGPQIRVRWACILSNKTPALTMNWLPFGLNRSVGSQLSPPLCRYQIHFSFSDSYGGSWRSGGKTPLANSSLFFFFFLSSTVLEDRPGNQAYRLGKQTGIQAAAVFNVLRDYICSTQRTHCIQEDHKICM